MALALPPPPTNRPRIVRKPEGCTSSQEGTCLESSYTVRSHLPIMAEVSCATTAMADATNAKSIIAAGAMRPTGFVNNCFMYEKLGSSREKTKTHHLSRGPFQMRGQGGTLSVSRNDGVIVQRLIVVTVATSSSEASPFSQPSLPIRVESFTLCPTYSIRIEVSECTEYRLYQ